MFFIKYERVDKWKESLTFNPGGGGVLLGILDGVYRPIL